MPPEKEIINQATQNHDMPWGILWHYAASAVVGGASGCAMAAALRAKGYKIDRWIVLSYAAFGAFCSLFITALIVMHGWRPLNTETVIVYGGGSALFFSSLLSGVNFSLHWSSRKLADRKMKSFGVEVEKDET